MVVVLCLLLPVWLWHLKLQNGQTSEVTSIGGLPGVGWKLDTGSLCAPAALSSGALFADSLWDSFSRSLLGIGQQLLGAVAL